ncbi:hypothetical protein RUND412_002511 [Rhizina undulata]
MEGRKWTGYNEEGENQLREQGGRGERGVLGGAMEENEGRSLGQWRRTSPGALYTEDLQPPAHFYYHYLKDGQNFLEQRETILAPRTHADQGMSLASGKGTTNQV